ncbi:MAG TPA: hypothetical protein VGI84_02980 [Pseudonocardiaceae bacterium]
MGATPLDGDPLGGRRRADALAAHPELAEHREEDCRHDLLVRGDVCHRFARVTRT